jgi:hypothetical protein
MKQYFFVDESGDPGLNGEAGSSSLSVISSVFPPELWIFGSQIKSITPDYSAGRKKRQPQLGYLFVGGG